MQQYEAPILTKYGKVENFIQAGSVALQSGDVTGDGTPDQAFDTNGDGRADVIVGGANGGTTPVIFFSNVTASNGINADFYDSDGDGQADIAIALGSLQTIDQQSYYYVTLSDSGYFVNRGEVGSASGATELSSNGGWNDPARD